MGIFRTQVIQNSVQIFKTLPYSEPCQGIFWHILTVLKSSFVKQKPRLLNYRNYKFFNNTLFRDQVLNKLINSNLQISNKDLKHFKETCMPVVNTIASLKSRFIQANQAPFINKEIQWGVMVRSKLRKKNH